MNSSENQFNEIELQRLMADQATRVEFSAHLHKRVSAMQALMSKIQSLSDSEFEAAYGTLESLIEKYNTKKNKLPKNSNTTQVHQDLGLTSKDS